MSGSDRLRRAHRFTVVPEALVRDPSVDDRAFRLWCLLDRYAGANDAAFPSRRTLSADLSCSPASVDRAVKALVEAGWLSKSLREVGGTNLYVLLDGSSPQVRPGPLVTGDEGGPSSPVMRGVVTSDDGGSSPVQSPLVTGDAQKEPSPKEPSPTEPGETAPRGAETRAEAKSARGTRLPENWTPDEGLKAWFREQDFARMFNPWDETEAFKDHWRAQPGHKGVKIDWDATWRNWMRETAKRLSRGRTQTGGNVHRLPGSDPDRQRRDGMWGPDATTG